MAKPVPVRVRIAPSPTGFLHIGTARTALFNWLFARKHGGSFIVRIEDTDAERSTPEFEQDILYGFRWLGLDWDEGPAVSVKGHETRDRGNFGPYRQSGRLDHYEKYLQQLLETRHAYHCFCAKEELEAQEASMKANGHPPRYSGKCRTLDAGTTARRLEAREKAVIRFRMPEEKISFHDLIRGSVSFDAALMGDIVIAKSVREPLYNFANVVDDFEMKISHVIRGEDHLANTAKQIMVAEALHIPLPQFAHLPLILNPDRSKMSKRFAATALREYREAGYLPDALINFMALLGWHPTHDTELMTRDELIREFELERVQKGGAVFNLDKLDWLNNQYIRRTENEALHDILNAMTPLPQTLPRERVLKLIGLTKERLRRIADFLPQTDFFFALPEYAETLLNWKQTPPQTTRENLEAARETLSTMRDADFTRIKLEEALQLLARARGRGEVLWPLRVALSGKDASPGPFEIMEVLGKEETLKRIEKAIEKLER